VCLYILCIYELGFWIVEDLWRETEVKNGYKSRELMEKDENNFFLETNFFVKMLISYNYMEEKLYIIVIIII